ncbi:MAG: hypothetical protein GY797_09790 [Deltaproteobacteria bacterium]|nr:hypothetical protein [Deltaproteobacteria bacterium]
MRSIIFFLEFVVGGFWIVGIHVCTASETISVGVNEPIFKGYEEITKNQSCRDVSEFDTINHRGVIDVLLFCQALDRGGYDATLELKKYPNYARSLFQAKIGEIDLPGETIWKTEIDPEFFLMSSPILRKGDLFFGIYTKINRKDVLAVTNLEELQKYSTAVQKNWIVDMEILGKLGVKVEYIGKPESAWRMLAGDRIDFILGGFAKDEKMEKHRAGIVAIPIPNLKLRVPGERRFALSKSNPNAMKILEAVEKGIRSLREEGKILKAYTDRGYIKAETKNWKVLNPRVSTP